MEQINDATELEDLSSFSRCRPGAPSLVKSLKTQQFLKRPKVSHNRVDQMGERIFLIYSELDQQFVMRLRKALRNAGHFPVDFKWSLFYGDQLMVVVVLSSHLLTSKWLMIDLHTLLTFPSSPIILPLFYNLPPDHLSTQKHHHNIPRVLYFDKHIMDEDNYIQHVLLHVSRITPHHVFPNFTGHERIIKEIDKIFQTLPTSASSEARILGLYGIGGQGKTTACKLMVNSYAITYATRCALIQFSTDDPDAEEMVSQYKQALIQFACPPALVARTVDGVYQFLELLKICVRKCHVFMALDNMYEAHLELAHRILDVGFSSNSKILVTSRSMDVLFRLLRDERRVMPLPSLNQLAYEDPLEMEESGALQVHDDLATREVVLHGHGRRQDDVDIYTTRVTKNAKFKSSPLQGDMGEGLVEHERVDSSTKALGSKNVEMTSFKNLQYSKSDAQSSISKETQLISSKSIFSTPSLIHSIASPIEPNDKGKKNDGIGHLLLELENTCLGKNIFVGVVVNKTLAEILEFFFFNAEDMAICVGVGLSQAKVILHNDLSITIEETNVSERELKDTWMPYLSNNNYQLVMNVKMEVPNKHVNGDDNHEQTFGTKTGETFSRLYGVGWDYGSHYIDETYDVTNVSWPLLYDMALFILTRKDLQCNETDGKSRAQGSRSFQGSMQNNIVDKLHGKRDRVFNHGNLQGGRGDSDEEDLACNQNVLEDDDYPPVVFKVTVHALPKDDIFGTQVKPCGLDGASIAPKLVFEFRQNGNINRISIKAQTHLELGSKMDVFYNTNLFGWYHNEIQISFGCEDIEGNEQSGFLEQNSCKILNPKISYKYIGAKARVSTEAATYTAGGQVGISVLQGSLSGSRMKREEASAGSSIEMARECICEGFSLRNFSCVASPARARFFLFYPFHNLSIWDDREFLHCQGLFSTIEPSIQGTWIPINKHDASPYSFKVERLLKLHERADHGLNDHVRIHKQEYVLPFFVNHAMTHLRNQRSPPIVELYGNQQSVPNVLMVGSVNMSRA